MALKWLALGYLVGRGSSASASKHIEKIDTITYCIWGPEELNSLMTAIYGFVGFGIMCLILSWLYVKWGYKLSSLLLNVVRCGCVPLIVVTLYHGIKIIHLVGIHLPMHHTEHKIQK